MNSVYPNSGPFFFPTESLTYQAIKAANSLLLFLVYFSYKMIKKKVDEGSLQDIVVDWACLTSMCGIRFITYGEEIRIQFRWAVR